MNLGDIIISQFKFMNVLNNQIALEKNIQNMLIAKLQDFVKWATWNLFAIVV